MLKRIVPLLLCLGASAILSAAADSVQEKYIEKYKDLAVSEMYRSGIPASITMAQGMLESSYGNSRLSREANNHFGIKCAKTWEGEKIYHDDDEVHECFRKYRTVDESYADHSDFIRYSARYASLFELEITDYVGWANGLKAAGYATDPRYASKLIDIIDKYKLYKLDTAQNPSKDSAAKPGKEKKKEKKWKKNKQEAPDETDGKPLSPIELITPKPSYDASWNFSIDRQVYQLNGVPMIYTFPEDNYEDLALKYNLFLKELLHFNDLDENPGEPAPGTIVYLKLKKAHAAPGQDKHIVDYSTDGIAPEEILRWISQRYGVRLSCILKINGLKADSIIPDGMEIRLRPQPRKAVAAEKKALKKDE